MLKHIDMGLLPSVSKIKRASKSAGRSKKKKAAKGAVETAETGGSDIIQSTSINQLLEAKLVIADLTDHNPNVLFELGIRITKELPVALIKAQGTGQIFDVDGMMRVLSYSPTLWPSKLAHDLPKLTDHIKAAWDNVATQQSYMNILIRK